MLNEHCSYSATETAIGPCEHHHLQLEPHSTIHTEQCTRLRHIKQTGRDGANCSTKHVNDLRSISNYGYVDAWSYRGDREYSTLGRARPRVRTRTKTGTKTRPGGRATARRPAPLASESASGSDGQTHCAILDGCWTGTGCRNGGSASDLDFRDDRDSVSIALDAAQGDGDGGRTRGRNSGRRASISAWR